MSDAARESGVSYATIRRHVIYSKPLSVEAARKLEEWSRGAISAARTLGLKTPERPQE